MAIANPDIVNYKPFYIQYGNNTTATDTRAAWGLIAKTNPYDALPTPKEPYKNEWLDENGDDEYTAAMAYESFTTEVDFFIKAQTDASKSAAQYIREAQSSLFNAIKTGSFKIYDSYTAIGRQNVRYAGYEAGEFWEQGGVARCTFKVKFKVNDPVTFMTLTNNAIVSV